MSHDEPQHEKEIDDLLREMGRDAGWDRIAKGRPATEHAESFILADLHPVRPLGPSSTYALMFAAVFATSAIVSGSILGLHGIHALDIEQAALIFTALFITAGLAAMACARSMRPASGAPLASPALLIAAISFPILFALIFKGYSMLNFVAEGIPCLRAGLVVATPTGLLIAWFLRRGFVLSWRTAGLAAGTLAGLSGLAMLELHCANLKAIHVIVWHVVVVLFSAFFGTTLGWIGDRTHHGRSSKKRLPS